MKSLRIALWLLVAIAAAVALILFAGQQGQEARDQKALASAFGGEFALVDGAGQTVTNASLKGKPFAIFFGFTRCPDVCPTSLQRMARLRKQLGADGDKFQIVFVSVDPEHDTPKQVADYVALFNTPIIGLSGDQAAIDKAVKAYKVYVKKVPTGDGKDYTIDHTAAIYLMDKDGGFAGTITHEENDKVALEKLQRLVS